MPKKKKIEETSTAIGSATKEDLENEIDWDNAPGPFSHWLEDLEDNDRPLGAPIHDLDD
jgi:hypothetical protein